MVKYEGECDGGVREEVGYRYVREFEKAITSIYNQEDDLGYEMQVGKDFL